MPPSKKHSFHVRFRNTSLAVKAAAWSDWIGPIVAMGPWAAAREIIRAEDWTDLPIDLAVEVEGQGTTRDFIMTVSLKSTTLVTLTRVLI